MRAIGFLLAVMPLFADATPPDARTQSERMAAIDRFASDGPIFLKRMPAEKLRKLGEVVNDATEATPNPHGEGSIKYTKLEFKEGLEVHFRSFGTPAQTQIVQVTVSSPKWQIKHGLNVGVPVEEVLKVLGEPNKMNNEEILFSGEAERVIFRTKGGYVVQVKFIYYAD